MRILLDTHTFLWFIEGSPHLICLALIAPLIKQHLHHHNNIIIA